ncbi:MAG TPA: dephospho-CoA kinase [Lacipirellulaceae bacterium]|nr:dephospho-CoA kinase [Lacipirellulaceae bacterium]
MHTIGLIGGVASGKPAVAAALAQRGAVAFNADQLAHQVLAEPEVRDALLARWGASILDDQGQVDRSRVADIVFAPGPAADHERQFLEQWSHPGGRRRIETAIRQLPDASIPAVVIDAALLIEAGWSGVCSAIVFVDSPRQDRLRRAQARGWTDEEFSRREAAQMPIEQKRGCATHVIDNSGTLAELDAAVDRFWTELNST